MANVATTRAAITTEIGNLDSAITVAMNAVAAARAAAATTDYDPGRSDGRSARPYQLMMEAVEALIEDRFAKLAMIPRGPLVQVTPKTETELVTATVLDNVEARIAGGA